MPCPRRMLPTTGMPADISMAAGNPIYSVDLPPGAQPAPRGMEGEAPALPSCTLHLPGRSSHQECSNSILKTAAWQVVAFVEACGHHLAAVGFATSEALTQPMLASAAWTAPQHLTVHVCSQATSQPA